MAKEATKMKPVLNESAENVVRSVPGDRHAEERQYRFEGMKRGIRRQLHDATLARGTLLERLNVPPSALGKEVESLLTRFARDLILNIDYYEACIAKKQTALKWRNATVVAFGVVACGAIATLGILNQVSVKESNLVAAQIGLIMAGVITAFQLIAAASDVKGQLNVFWKASSELKQHLFGFEDMWRDKVIKDGEVDPNFVLDVRATLEKARSVTENERGAFFGTLKSPSELINIVSTGFDTLRLRRQDVATSTTELATSLAAAPGSAATKAQEVEQARKTKRDAEAVLIAKRALVDALMAETNGDYSKELKDARVELMKAEADIKKADASLQKLTGLR